jgi:hypothetical protein
MLFESGVEIFDISGVMHVVVKLHGLGVDYRFERSIVIGESGQLM